MSEVCLIILTLIALTAALIHTQAIMIPFVLALFIAFTSLPAIRFFQATCKLPRAIAIIATASVVILSFAGLSLVVFVSVQGALENLDQYRERVLVLVEKSIELASSFGYDAKGLSVEELKDTLNRFPLFSYLRTIAGKMVGFVSNTTLVLIFAIFLISGKSPEISQSSLWLEIDRKIRTYILTKTMASTATGLLTGLALWFLGVDMAWMFGSLAFFLNFIPTVGSLLAMLLPIPIALLQFDNFWSILLVVLVPGTIQFVIGNVIEPMIMGDALDLHPVTLLLFLMFWGMIWGVPGMFLAAPIAVIVKILVSENKRPNWLGDLMAGRI